jgi:hypothetical protein
VSDVNELDLEWADLDGLLGLDLAEIDVLIEVVFSHTPLDQSQSEGCSEDRNIDLGKEEGHGTDVIFVAVSENERSDHFAMLNQVSQIRGYEVDSQEFIFWEHHAAVDYYDVAAVADRHHVHAKLAESAEWYYL